MSFIRIHYTFVTYSMFLRQQSLRQALNANRLLGGAISGQQE